MRLINFIFNHNNGYRVSSLFLFLLNYFSVEIPEGATELVQFASNMLIFSLVSFTSFVNVIITFYILYYFKDSNFEDRFKNRPLIIRIIKFYLNTSKLTLFLEIIICLASILIILISTCLVLGIILY